MKINPNLKAFFVAARSALEAESMAMKWADEVSNYDPLPELETFYTFVAIELGDPDKKGWIMNQALRFYDLFQQWYKGKELPCEPTEALLQYILWYDKESRKVKTHS